MTFAVALVSDTVLQNFVAWSHPIESFPTLEEANEFATAWWAENHDTVKNETLIIHNGEECF